MLLCVLGALSLGIVFAQPPATPALGSRTLSELLMGQRYIAYTTTRAHTGNAFYVRLCTPEVAQQCIEYYAEYDERRAQEIRVQQRIRDLEVERDQASRNGSDTGRLEELLAGARQELKAVSFPAGDGISRDWSFGEITEYGQDYVQIHEFGRDIRFIVPTGAIARVYPIAE